MYARNVTMRLKPNAAGQFSTTIEQLLPMLRKREGFADELALVTADGKEAVAMSLWDNKEHAEAYGRETYPEVLKGLGNIVEGTPVVHGFQVAHSTFHKVPARS